jgi:hypothetical protein
MLENVRRVAEEQGDEIVKQPFEYIVENCRIVKTQGPQGGEVIMLLTDEENMLSMAG